MKKLIVCEQRIISNYFLVAFAIFIVQNNLFTQIEITNTCQGYHKLHIVYKLQFSDLFFISRKSP